MGSDPGGVHRNIVSFLLPSEEEKSLLKELCSLVQAEDIYEEFFQRIKSIKDIQAFQKVFTDPERAFSFKKKVSTFFINYLTNPCSPEVNIRSEAVACRHLEAGVSPVHFKEGLFVIWHILYQRIKKISSPDKQEALRVLLTKLVLWLSLQVINKYFEIKEKDLAASLEELKILNRIYALLREINLLIFEEQHEEQHLFEKACGIMVRVGGFALAWVAVNRPPSTEVKIVAAAGETEYLKDFLTSTDPQNPEGQGPCGISLREGCSVVIGDVDKDPRFRPWAERAKRFGIRSVAALPLHLRNRSRGSLLLYSHNPHHFTQKEILLLEEIARDLSLGYIHIKKSQALEKALFWDEVTGLSNQRYLLVSLEQELNIATSQDIPLVLVKMDLDHFSAVNVKIGRIKGDLILREVGARLRRLVDSFGTVARVGADEFAFSYLLNDMNPAILLDRVRNILSEPFPINGEEVTVTASMGVAVFPKDATTPEGLLEAASFALIEAKNKAPQGIAFYSQEIAEKAYTYYDLLRRLEEAYEKNEFVLYFQPRIDLASRKPTSLEALIRWNSPEMGLVSPGEFIPVLEESGLIVEVGRWVVLEAAKALKQLRKEFPDLRLSFNVSVKQFLEKEVLLLALKEALSKTGLPGNSFEMEVTESLLLEVGPNGQAFLEEISKDLGLEIALDDFGTGYSSFSYLKRIPANSIKVDYSFVRGLPSNREDAEVVMAIVSMARNLGKRTVAEGVERKEQLAFLSGLGVDEVQGFLFAKPMPFEKVCDFLRSFDPTKSFW
ncbi:putative bifunctional diguanylate cyclase/phosphodiesterase [Thermosulfidibacter takaii]|nr:GGDEF domain-containing protein [Thermosulfidibacter takaii]